MYSNALSPERRLRKSHVMRALASIRFFSASMVLGTPVEPEVLTLIVGESLCHSLRNSERVMMVIN